MDGLVVSETPKSQSLVHSLQPKLPNSTGPEPGPDSKSQSQLTYPGTVPGPNQTRLEPGPFGPVQTISNQHSSTVVPIPTQYGTARHKSLTITVLGYGTRQPKLYASVNTIESDATRRKEKKRQKKLGIILWVGRGK